MFADRVNNTKQSNNVFDMLFTEKYIIREGLSC